MSKITRSGLSSPKREHAACGVGFVARVDGHRTRETVEEGLEVLRNLDHRGASGGDPETGDGGGILLQIPDAFLRRECASLNVELPQAGGYGVGMLFEFEGEEGPDCEGTLERIVAEEGQRFLGWRDVPVEPEAAGQLARSVMPRIRQFFVENMAGDEAAFERKLYVVRRRLQGVAEDRCYVTSLSGRTLVYKGLLKGKQLPEFYPDLKDPAVASALALVHSRFSTNTLGTWDLAHPYHYVGHNGEINTLRGNINWLRARKSQFSSSLFGEDIEKIVPVVDPDQSDSATFDDALELLCLAGRRCHTRSP